MESFKIPDRLLNREELAYFLNVDVDTLHKYEKEGIIRRVPGIKSPRYSPRIIAELAEIDPSDFSPFLLRQALKKNKELERENAMLRGQIEQIKKLVG